MGRPSRYGTPRTADGRLTTALAIKGKGPKPRPLVGHLIAYARDPLGFQLGLAESVGAMAPYRLAGQDLVLVTDPGAVRDVFSAGSECLVKGRALQAARRVVGDGLLTSEGDAHLRARRMLAPIFAPKAIGRYAPLMVEASAKKLRGWRAGQVRDIAEDMAELTLEIIAQILFRRDIEGETAAIGAALDDALRLIARLTIPFYKRLEWLPLPSHRRFRRALRTLDALVYRLIDERRALREPDDLLSGLMAAEDDEGDGSALTDRQVRDEVMTLFLAGHETTANGMAWTFELLGRHPACDARLAAEVREVIGDRAPELADVERLPYTRQVILEALRLKPPVWNIARRAVQDVAIGGCPVARDTVLITSPYTSHRQAAFFADPEAFRPERWESGDPRRSHRYQYFPFGGGRRVCIGEHFSILEMTLILATVASRFRLEPAYEGEVKAQPTITIRPVGGLPMRVVARS
jgi:cytochrome P450